MTEELLPKETLEPLRPETITPGLLVLVSDDAPSKMIMGAGAGCFAEIRVTETPGLVLGDDELSADAVWVNFDKVRDPIGAAELAGAFDQTKKYVIDAASKRGIKTSWV